MPPTTAQNVITNALLEIGAIAAGEVPASQDSNFCLSKLNRMLDVWDADGLNLYTVQFLNVILVPNVQPLTIGEAVSVTKVSAAANVATYTGNNRYNQGDTISTGNIGTIGGVQFNLSNVIVQSATPTQFTLTCGAGAVGTTAVVGQAIYPGPLGDAFPNYPTTTQRPALIHNANIILNNVSPIVKVPLRIRDADWWAANSVPNVLTTLPTDLYYEPQWPNGSLYLWPEQTSTFGLELEIWINLAGLNSLTTQFYLPQGYENTITDNLAVALCPSFGRPLDPTLARLAMTGLGKIQARNSASPKIMTRDAGLPRGSHNRSYFNWLNGATTGPR